MDAELYLRKLEENGYHFELEYEYDFPEAIHLLPKNSAYEKVPVTLPPIEFHPDKEIFSDMINKLVDQIKGVPSDSMKSYIQSVKQAIE